VRERRNSEGKEMLGMEGQGEEESSGRREVRRQGWRKYMTYGRISDRVSQHCTLLYLLLRMGRRAGDRCPPCPPSLYGPICARTDLW
jgi:hypothetical protein